MDVSRASRRKIDALVGRLDRIQRGSEAAPGQLEAFRDGYGELPSEDRPALFVAILGRLEVCRDEILPALRGVEEADHDHAAGWSQVVTDLRRKLESPRLRAFRRFVNLSGGIKFLLPPEDFLFTVRAVGRTGHGFSHARFHLLHLFSDFGFIDLKNKRDVRAETQLAGTGAFQFFGACLLNA